MEAVSVSCHSDPKREVVRSALDCQQLKKCSARPSKKPQARRSCQRSCVSPRNGADLVQVQDSVFSLIESWRRMGITDCHGDIYNFGVKLQITLLCNQILVKDKLWEKGFIVVHGLNTIVV